MNRNKSIFHDFYTREAKEEVAKLIDGIAIKHGGSPKEGMNWDAIKECVRILGDEVDHSLVHFANIRHLFYAFNADVIGSMKGAAPEFHQDMQEAIELLKQFIGIQEQYTLEGIERILNIEGFESMHESTKHSEETKHIAEIIPFGTRH